MKYTYFFITVLPLLNCTPAEKQSSANGVWQTSAEEAGLKGRIFKIVQETWAGSHDPAGTPPLYQVYYYDQHNMIVRKTDSVAPHQKRLTTSAYDGFNRMTKSVIYYNDDPESATTVTFNYSDNYQRCVLTLKSKSESRNMRMYHNARGQAVAQVIMDGTGHVTDSMAYTYNDQRLVKLENYKNVLVSWNTFTYDNEGNLVEEKVYDATNAAHPDILTYQYAFDENHNWIKQFLVAKKDTVRSVYREIVYRFEE